MKTSYLILMIVLININTYAQVPTYQWAKSAGGSANSDGRSVSTDASGNVFITGGFRSPTITFGTTTLTLTGTYGSNIFIVKYDASGNVLWAKNAGGTGIGAYGWSISNDVSGNVFLTGFFHDPAITFGNITVNNSGFNNRNIFIAKYDANGNAIWAKNVGSLYTYGSGLSICNDANGNVFITGSFAGPTITIGTYTLTNAGGNSDSDLFIVKYDSSGNVIWAKNVGGTGGEIGWGISTDANGNVFITGEFSSATVAFGTTMLTKTLFGGGGDIFIAKYDGNGNALWAKSCGSTGGDQGRGISIDTSGNVFITGSFQGPTITVGTTTLTNSGYNDIIVAKYDNNGNELWARNAGGILEDNGLGISTDVFGNAFITGEFDSDTITFGSTVLIKAASRNVFIAKYSASGNILWADSKGISYSSGFSISADSGGDAYITGTFGAPSITFGNTVLSSNSGNVDIFITKLSQTTGIEIIKKETSINIAPNPFTYKTTIYFKTEQVNSVVKITDIFGKEIKEIKFTGKELLIEKGIMQTGLYFVQVIDENKHISNSKIIIQ